MQIEFNIGILSPKSIDSREEGRSFLEMLCRTIPECSPDRYGNYEPLRKIFAKSTMEEVLDTWSTSQFFWKHLRPKSEGSVWMKESGLLHTSIFIDGDKYSVNLNVIGFLKECSLKTDADFAYIQFTTEEEWELMLKDNSLYIMRSPLLQGVCTHDLRKCLPDLSWATVFGLPYVRLFGLDRLLSAPAAIASRLNDETVYLQLTENPTDIATRRNEIEEIRKKVKQHLGPEAFYDPGIGFAGKYLVPEFNL